MQNCAIVVAAGRGKRFGGYKQFHMYRDHPILYYALRAFERYRSVDEIVLVVPKNRIAFVKAIIKRSRFQKIKAVVPGGKRRQDSVKNGFQVIERRTGCVIIHDGARPAVNPGLLQKGLRLCRKYRAVIFGLPVTDTVKIIRDHRVVSTLNRRELSLVQTPQFFRVSLLAEAYARVDFDRNFTDEAGLVEAAGFPVYHFEGDRENIKITERGDLQRLGKRL